VSVSEIIFLDVEAVIALHQIAVEESGGDPGLRDLGLLESAVAAPAASFGGEWAHDGLFAMAAAYAFHIAKNHAFIDGNKRTAIGAALAFLDVNGYALDPALATTDRLVAAMVAVATGELDKAGLGRLLAELSRLRVS
jgi:death-on-curing protein